jgi:hypothetical protein
MDSLDVANDVILVQWFATTTFGRNAIKSIVRTPYFIDRRMQLRLYVLQLGW